MRPVLPARLAVLLATVAGKGLYFDPASDPDHVGRADSLALNLRAFAFDDNQTGTDVTGLPTPVLVRLHFPVHSPSFL